jgi:hypothetical protein
MSAEKAWPGALESAVGSLIALRTRLQEMHGSSHQYNRTSASQADAAYDKFKRGEPLNNTEFAATMFANSQHVRQFQASVFVTSIVIRKSIDAVEYSNRRNDLTSLLGQFRSLMERFAHLHYLYKKVDKRMAAHDETASHPFLSTFDIDRDVKRALYGTTVKWNEIARKPLEEIDVQNDLGKNLRSELGNYFAKQILDKIDELDRTHPGTRAAYEILCDFLHPNVGDLFSSTTDYSEFDDRFAVRHIVRQIEADKNLAWEPTADQVVLEKVYAHFVKLASRCGDDFETCKRLDNQLTKQLSDYTREILKANKPLFKKVDLCPCSSGLAIFRCCGRGLMIG